MKDQLHKWVIGFAVVKFILHLYTNNLYGLHRDEYLYIDEGKHLAWGFMEVPPFVPFLAWIGDLFGNHAWIYKCMPAIAGSLIIYIIGKLIIELGGKKWAVIITSVALLCSPALLRNATMFQPVIFNQLAWLLCGYWVIKIIKDDKDKYYYWLGITIGLAFLTKYSIVFYGTALVIGLLLTQQRSILFKRPTIYTLLIATAIALPNLWWQFTYGWPVLAHMAELQEKQLVHVQWSAFLTEQLLCHSVSAIVWIVGVFAVFRYVAYYRYRFIVFAFFTTIIIIGALSGKAYYTIGAFYILFPFGGIALEQLLDSPIKKYAFIVLVVAFAVPLAPLGTPLVPMDKFMSYSNAMISFTGYEDYLYWEDGEKHDLPQDYADMNGWEELAQNVAKHYHALPAGQKEKTIIYGGSYGHAGALNFYREKYKLPETFSTNGSYLWWAEENVQFENVIVIEEEYAEKWSYFDTMVLLDSIRDPYARDKGYTYLLSDPNRDPSTAWRAMYLSRRNRFVRQ